MAMNISAPRALVVLAGLGLLATGCNVGSQQGYEPPQPIAYSHAQHAGDLQIPCGYCHSGAERSRHAGVPAVSTCMNCHTQVKPDSPEIQKLSRALAGGEPVQWVKVHRLPDHVYFSHKSHTLTAGLACQTCHGPVQQMVRVRQANDMSLGWCLSCHRASAKKTLLPTALAPMPTDCSACHQ